MQIAVVPLILSKLGPRDMLLASLVQDAGTSYQEGLDSCGIGLEAVDAIRDDRSSASDAAGIETEVVG